MTDYNQPSSYSPFVKVCGITNQGDLSACMGMGVNFCGFIFHERSYRYVSPRRAASLRSGTMKRVGVFVDQNAQEINRIMDDCRLDFAQLHGSQSVECAHEIEADRVIRVLWPQRYGDTEGLIAEMEKFASSSALFLLDAGLQGGGRGMPVNWEALANLNPPRPWILAGGLSAQNLPLALSNCTPNGIDLNSGVEWAPGHKSVKLLLNALHNLTNHHYLTAI